MPIVVGIFAGLFVGMVAGSPLAFSLLGAGVGIFVWWQRTYKAETQGASQELPEAIGSEDAGTVARMSVLERLDALDRRLSRIERALSLEDDEPASPQEPSVPARPQVPPAVLEQPAAAAPADAARASEPPLATAPGGALAPDQPVQHDEFFPNILRVQAEATGIPHEAAASELSSEPPAAAAQAPTDEESASESAPPFASGPPLVPEWVTRLITGNIVAKVGVLILFFGVGFLLKYAAERGLFPPQLRVIGVASAGLGMVFGGWRLTARRRIFGLVVQGGGIGLLYLAVFFMLHWYGMLSAAVAFVLFALFGVATILLSLPQNAPTLAVLGLTGAFLAPLLASTGSGNHIVLFSYYALLNVFIAIVAWYRPWRALNLAGFFFTFVVGFAWGWQYYTPGHFASVQPFLAFFFALYLVLPVLYAKRQPPQLRAMVDGTLVFGTPVAGVFLQAALVRSFEYGLAWSAAIVGVAYLVLWVLIRRREPLALLSEAYLALGTVFLTLAVPFAFDHYPTFGLWTLEGAALVWVGARQRRTLARAFGYLTHLGGAVFLLLDYRSYAFENPVFNGFVLGCVLVAAASLVIALSLRAQREHIDEAEKPLIDLALWWGAAWWYAGALHAIHYGLPREQFIAWMLALASLTSMAGELAGSRLRWAGLRAVSSLATMAVVGALLLTVVRELEHPFMHGGVIAWPLALAVLFWTARRRSREDADPSAEFQVNVGWALAFVVATWEAWWAIDRGYYGLGALWGIAGLTAAWWRWRSAERDTDEATRFSLIVLLWGLAVWYGTGWTAIYDLLAPELRTAALLALAAGSTLLFEWIGSLLRWPALRASAAVLTFSLLWSLWLASHAGLEHPMENFGVLAWPLALATQFWANWRRERDDVDSSARFQYWVGWAVLAAAATWEAWWAISSDRYLLGLGWGIAGLVAAWLRWRLRERGRADAPDFSVAVMLWGLGVWFWAGTAAVMDQLPRTEQPAALVALYGGSALLFELAGALGHWTPLRRTQPIAVFALTFGAALTAYGNVEPLDWPGLVAWPVAAFGFYYTLYRQEQVAIALEAEFQQLVALLVLTLLTAWQLSAWTDDWTGHASSWTAAVWMAVPVLLLALLTWLQPRLAWPLGKHREIYLVQFGVIVLGASAIWSVLANFALPGDSRPMPYLPFLNPLDVTHAIIIGCAVLWQTRYNQGDRERALNFFGGRIGAVTAAIGFVWVNAMLLRTLHHWADVPYTLVAIRHSVLAQAALSLLWTSIALAVMVHAVRAARRMQWIAGAVLLGVVVLKLFALALDNSGSVARIVSFLGVGVLVLAIGYFAPVPPGEVEQQA